MIVSHKVLVKSFCKSRFPHKSVYLFFILVIVKDKLTDFWGELTSAKQLYRNFLWDQIGITDEVRGGYVGLVDERRFECSLH